MMSEAKRRADDKYKKKAYTQFSVRLHNEKEADVIEHMNSVENKRDYLIKLIRSDIKK